MMIKVMSDSDNDGDDNDDDGFVDDKQRQKKCVIMEEWYSIRFRKLWRRQVGLR